MTAPGARVADVTAVMHKVVDAMPVAPNLVDYDTARAQFSWDAARARLAGLPAGGVLMRRLRWVRAGWAFHAPAG